MLWNLVIDCFPNKITVCQCGGVEALLGLLMQGTTAASHFYAGRALVHVATDHPEGRDLITRRIKNTLFCPNTLQFRTPLFVADEQIREIQVGCLHARRPNAPNARISPHHPSALSTLSLRLASQEHYEKINNGHGVIIRLASPTRLCNLLACLLSIELEPARACVAYELTPQSAPEPYYDDDEDDETPAPAQAKQPSA